MSSNTVKMAIDERIQKSSKRFSSCTFLMPQITFTVHGIDTPTSSLPPKTGSRCVLRFWSRCTSITSAIQAMASRNFLIQMARLDCCSHRRRDVAFSRPEQHYATPDDTLHFQPLQRRQQGVSIGSRARRPRKYRILTNIPHPVAGSINHRCPSIDICTCPVTIGCKTPCGSDQPHLHLMVSIGMCADAQKVTPYFENNFRKRLRSILRELQRGRRDTANGRMGRRRQRPRLLMLLAAGQSAE